MVINIFLSVLIVVRILTGLRLLINGRKNKLPNLIWLAGSMFLTVIVLLFSDVVGNPLGSLPISPWVFTLGSLLGIAALIVFNQLTFYKDRKSRGIVSVWVILIISSLMTIYGVTVSSRSYQSPWGVTYILCAAIIWAWHGWLAAQALTKVSSEPSVHDWVKTRYKLIVTYSVVLIIGSFASIVRYLFLTGTELSALISLMSLVVLIGQILSVTLLFLVWVMPEAFRLWLNRNYQKRRDDKVTEQALAMIDILGTAMSNETELTKILAVRGIRKLVAQKINTDDSKKIEAFLINYGYDDWLAFLNDPALHHYIQYTALVSPVKVLENAKHTLIENQSLFTLQAR